MCDIETQHVQHVFLVGAKSLGAYGGYETFINKLTEYHQNNSKIKYHVACKANGDGCMDPYKTEGATIISDNEFTYHNAHCFRIKVPEILGSAQAIYYDIAAIKECCEIIRDEKIKHPIVYIMTCRIGPFIRYFYKEIHNLGGVVYLNPDGHEWMRAKWPVPVRRYWKWSERKMVKLADLVICDSMNIETYIKNEYGIENTTYIAYGADVEKSILDDDDPKFTDWLKEKKLKVNQYYLAVGRFVPENNYETMIREFMRSNSSKDFVLVTNVNEKFLKELESKLHWKDDGRIKFVGTVYDKDLLKKIRENAYGYFHGHEVGGTNPSLLESLASTELNLLLDVSFNREVGEKNVLYWNKSKGNLAGLINKTDTMDESLRAAYGYKAKERVKSTYSWELIGNEYERVWMR